MSNTSEYSLRLREKTWFELGQNKSKYRYLSWLAEEYRIPNNVEETVLDCKSLSRTCRTKVLKQEFRSRMLIDHFTVVSLLTWPLNGSDALRGLFLIKTSLFFLCKSSCLSANCFHLNVKSRDVCIKERSPPALLEFLGLATKHTTVKWAIVITCFSDILQLSTFDLPAYCLAHVKSPLKVPVSHQNRCTGGPRSRETRSLAKHFLSRRRCLGSEGMEIPVPESFSKDPLPNFEPTFKTDIKCW